MRTKDQLQLFHEVKHGARTPVEGFDRSGNFWIDSYTVRAEKDNNVLDPLFHQSFLNWKMFEYRLKSAGYALDRPKVVANQGGAHEIIALSIRRNGRLITVLNIHCEIDPRNILHMTA